MSHLLLVFLAAFSSVLALTAGFDVPAEFCAKYDLMDYMRVGLSALKCVDDTSGVTTDCNAFLECFDPVVERGYTDGLPRDDFVQLTIARFNNFIDEETCPRTNQTWQAQNDREFLRGDCPQYPGLLEEYRFLDRYVPRDPSHAAHEPDTCGDTVKQLFDKFMEGKKKM